jgi:hypothetical protein
MAEQSDFVEVDESDLNNKEEDFVEVDESDVLSRRERAKQRLKEGARKKVDEFRRRRQKKKRFEKRLRREEKLARQKAEIEAAREKARQAAKMDTVNRELSGDMSTPGPVGVLGLGFAEPRETGGPAPNAGVLGVAGKRREDDRESVDVLGLGTFTTPNDTDDDRGANAAVLDF